MLIIRKKDIIKVENNILPFTDWLEGKCPTKARLKDYVRFCNKFNYRMKF